MQKAHFLHRFVLMNTRHIKGSRKLARKPKGFGFYTLIREVSQHFKRTNKQKVANLIGLERSTDQNEASRAFQGDLTRG